MAGRVNREFTYPIYSVAVLHVGLGDLDGH